jgi:hypothetical protein
VATWTFAAASPAFSGRFGGIVAVDADRLVKWIY